MLNFRELTLRSSSVRTLLVISLSISTESRSSMMPSTLLQQSAMAFSEPVKDLRSDSNLLHLALRAL